MARWDGTAWSALGTGISYGANTTHRYPATVYAVAVAPTGEVYVGGEFTQAGGIVANGIAQWNGTAWSPLGAGLALNPVTLESGAKVVAVAGNGEVYVGGSITGAGGLAANGVAKWNGTAWSTLGTGTNGPVQALAARATGQLYAGGTFTATGDGSKTMLRFGIYDPAAPLATAAAKATPAGQLFPNPAHGTATLRLPAGTARQPLTLTDALGRLVRQYPAPAGPDAVLDLRGLPAGVYLVRCRELSQRLVVE